MTDKEYLEAVLKSQDLKDDSRELKDLQKERANVEKLLGAGFPGCSPTIRYGGSKAKTTLIKEDYDLDIASYFPNDDTSAGETLKDIYDNTEKALAGEYNVVRKRTALRLRSKKDVDFHIDVVPGRFTDDTKSDCFLHQEGADKDRLKTNLDVHIEHIRDSGLLLAIRILKLWKTRKAIGVKQFAFELLIIELLNGTDKSLPDQVKHVWTKLRDREDPVSIEDPANPTGNDLSDLLDDTVWSELSSVAKRTLETLEKDGWEAIFGKVSSGEDQAEKAQRAAAGVTAPNRPWLPEE
jgi:tRNA nucleotidyltransferase (CCA-adding enzyme)